MKKITIIRHAQSHFNAGNYKTDEEIRNCRITPYGVEQSKQLHHSFDVLIISPLKRAMETYLNSNIKCRQLIMSELFREQKEDKPLNYLDFEEIKPESPEDARKRAREAIEFIKTIKSDNIGIISHGCFIWYLLEQVGQPPQPTHNCQAIQFNILN
ncbi:histidine phosphatase superfamily clade-1 [Fadolivirus algeromassiliense]|jgi:broad specificity phosphatase PhoE|uniref:Histidine phosphatase superfamily clade-1 n=1 Tax=Fadolivirus FV1/VV64 TaxID=3070911 RepID=A0A7D3R2Q4_9VIRU|nr:histidine phosphatase superfamily clade-1 [Fadolivirus algeromassiliense]QKF94678.1 histidine phosphatase superfamily clade-1 [Fadolivirus FV1/VV64]